MRAEEATAALRQTLGEVVAPCGPPGAAAPPMGLSESLSHLHPLSGTSLSSARRRAQESIEALRSCAKARDSWDQPAQSASNNAGSAGGGGGIEHKERLLAVMRDSGISRRRLNFARDVLKKCIATALTKDPFAHSNMTAAQRLRIAATEAGATVVFEALGNSAGNGPLVTVCGERFIADFTFGSCEGELTNNAVQQQRDEHGEKHLSSPVQVEVAFRHIGGPGTEPSPPDAGVDADFSALLKNGEFDVLGKAFRRLIALEALEKRASVRGAPSLKDALQTVAADVAVVHGERARFGALGLRISYAENHAATLGAEDASPPRSIAVSSTRPTQIARPPQPGSTSVTPAGNFAFPAAPRMALLPAQYVLILEKPVVVARALALELNRIAQSRAVAASGGRELMGTERFGASAIQSASGSGAAGSSGASGSGSRSQQQGQNAPSAAALDALASAQNEVRGHVDSFASLQVLLARDVFGEQASVMSEADVESMVGSKMKNPGHVQGQGESLQVPAPAAWVKALDDGRMLAQGLNEYICAAELPGGGSHVTFSHSVSNLVPAVTVSRIPVCTAQDVLSVFAMLRQQLTFNELFASCFGQSRAVGEDSVALVDELVEVDICDAPQFMHFGIFDISMDGVVGLSVNIGLDGTVNASIKTPDKRPHPCPDAKITELLRASRNVPLAIQALMKHSRDSPNVMRHSRS